MCCRVFGCGKGTFCHLLTASTCRHDHGNIPGYKILNCYSCDLAAQGRFYVASLHLPFRRSSHLRSLPLTVYSYIDPLEGTFACQGESIDGGFRPQLLASGRLRTLRSWREETVGQLSLSPTREFHTSEHMLSVLIAGEAYIHSEDTRCDRPDPTSSARMSYQ